MLLVSRRPREEAIPTKLLDVYVQLLVTAVCLGVVFAFEEYPLTWIVLLPAIWAGMTMGPWTSAAYGLTGTLAVVVAQAIPQSTRSYGTSDLSALLLLDSLMTAFVFVVLLLSLLRDQRAHLAGEVVRRRQEALDQAGLFGTVFESISEGLVLMDPSGGVQLHNAPPYACSAGSGSTPSPQDGCVGCRRSPTFTYSYNRDGTDDGVRMLAVQLAEVQYAGSDGIVTGTNYRPVADKIFELGSAIARCAVEHRAAYDDGTRRTEILQTAASLIASSGLRTSLQEIADAAGILPGSLYHHFESKEAILVELVRRYYADLDRIGEIAHERLDKPDSRAVADKIVELGSAIARCAVEHRAALQMSFYEAPSANPELVELLQKPPTAVQQAMLQTLRAGRWSGYIRSDIDLPTLADRICQTMMHVGLDIIRHTAAADQTAVVMCRIMLHGLASRPHSDSELNGSDCFRGRRGSNQDLGRRE